MMKPIVIDPSWIKVQHAFSMVPGKMTVRASIIVQAVDYCEEAHTEQFLEVMKQRLIETLAKPESDKR